MQLVRGIALFFAGVIIVALIAAALMPETMRVERSIVINKPVGEVFSQVADLRNWSAWSPWQEMDPEAVHSISTPSRGKGAQWSWEGDKLGKGRLVQEEIEENKMIRNTMVFEEPTESTGTDLWEFEGADAQTTQVRWIDEMEMEYPVGRLSSFFLKPTLEEQMDRGLQNLKGLLEKEPEPKAQPAPVVPDSATVIGT
jgi:hypothetical protein